MHCQEFRWWQWEHLVQESTQMRGAHVDEIALGLIAIEEQVDVSEWLPRQTISVVLEAFPGRLSVAKEAVNVDNRCVDGPGV